MKLSPTQRSALAVLSDGGWVCACEMQVSMATLESLERRDLVRASHRIDSTWFPRTVIEWRITATGRGAIAEAIS